MKNAPQQPLTTERIEFLRVMALSIGLPMADIGSETGQQLVASGAFDAAGNPVADWKP